jgi:hypothetical protein
MQKELSEDEIYLDIEMKFSIICLLKQHRRQFHFEYRIKCKYICIFYICTLKANKFYSIQCQYARIYHARIALKSNKILLLMFSCCVCM